MKVMVMMMGLGGRKRTLPEHTKMGSLFMAAVTSHEVVEKRDSETSRGSRGYYWSAVAKAPETCSFNPIYFVAVRR